MFRESQRRSKMENRIQKAKCESENHCRKEKLNAEKVPWRLKKATSNEEIKGEKKKTDQKQNGGTIDAASRKMCYGPRESYWDGFEAGLFTDGVERARGSVTRKIAAEKRKLVVEPHGEICAAAPHKCGTGQEQQITENSHEPERRACSPIHKSSPQTNHLTSWTPGTARSYSPS
jgi:hypothetical protein